MTLHLLLLPQESRRTRRRIGHRGTRVKEAGIGIRRRKELFPLHQANLKERLGRKESVVAPTLRPQEGQIVVVEAFRVHHVGKHQVRDGALLEEGHHLAGIPMTNRSGNPTGNPSGNRHR